METRKGAYEQLTEGAKNLLKATEEFKKSLHTTLVEKDEDPKPNRAYLYCQLSLHDLITMIDYLELMERIEREENAGTDQPQHSG